MLQFQYSYRNYYRFYFINTHAVISKLKLLMSHTRVSLKEKVFWVINIIKFDCHMGL